MTSQKFCPLQRLLLTCAFGALVLTGCGKSNQNSAANTTPDNSPPPLAALPLATGAAPAAAPAPAATQLPPPPTPISYAVPAGNHYAYLDRAYALRQAIAEAPPDFTYDYDGQQPMTWRADDGSECVAEQLPDGSLRYYFYQPGAYEPYLVEDPDYSYGYSNGTLVVVYDAEGNVAAADAAQRQEDIAGRYLARAEALYQASVRDQHEAVAVANWERQRERVYQDEQRWVHAQDRDAAWRDYHRQQQDQEKAHWAQERYRRESEASRFAHTINDTAAIARAAQELAAAADEAKRYNQPILARAPPPNVSSPTPPAAREQREQRPPPPAAPPPSRAMTPPQPARPPPSQPDHGGRDQRQDRAVQAPTPAPAAVLPARDQREHPPLPAPAAAPAALPTPLPAREQREQRPERLSQPAHAAPPAAAAAPATPPLKAPAREQREQRPLQSAQAAPSAPAAPPTPPLAREQREQRPQHPPQSTQAAPPAPAATPAPPPSKARTPSKQPAAAPTPPAKPAVADQGKKPPRTGEDDRPSTP